MTRLLERLVHRPGMSVHSPSLVVRRAKDCYELPCSLPLLSEASFLPDKEVSMLCSVCECRLVTSEIRDRNGTPFLAWECPRVNHHFRAPGGKEVPLWLSLRPAAPILVPTLIAVATMLLSL
jgi:hypothetical protein